MRRMVSTITGAESIADSTTVVMSSFGDVATVALLVLLVIRELATASGNPRVQLLGRHPYVAVVPLLFVFCVILAATVL